jgi:hypothetical protein
MEQVVFKIPKASDKVLLSFCRHLSEIYDPIAVSTQALGGIHLTGLPTADDDRGWSTIIELNSALISNLQISIGGLGVHYYRNTRNPADATIYDEILISYNANAGEVLPDDRLRIIAAVNSKLKAFDPKASLVTSGIAANNYLEALHQSTLNRLEELGEDIVRKGIETYSRLEAEFVERRRSQDEEVQRTKSNLEQQHAVELNRLHVAQEEFERRKSEIDDRDNTHARREIRNSMLNDVKARIENFGVSDLTTAKRRPVAQGLAALALSFAILVIATAAEIFYEHRIASLAYSKSETVLHSENPTRTDAPVAQPKTALTEPDRTSLFYLWVRFSLLSAGMLGILFYYVRWQNRWADQHAASEFQLQQFYIDVNRANWVIESGLEWRKETEAEMPDIVLSSITKNLFNAAHEVPPVLHPADELASALLGSASKLKLKAGDSELEFDKPAKIPKS